MRLIELNINNITGVREKVVQFDNEIPHLTCTAIDYNGRERLVLETLLEVIKAIACADDYRKWEVHSKYEIPERYSKKSLGLKFTQPEINTPEESEMETADPKVDARPAESTDAIDKSSPYYKYVEYINSILNLPVINSLFSNQQFSNQQLADLDTIRNQIKAIVQDAPRENHTAVYSKLNRIEYIFSQTHWLYTNLNVEQRHIVKQIFNKTVEMKKFMRHQDSL